MAFYKNPIAICAAILLIAFFLPWVSIFGKSVAGYKIGMLGPRLAQASYDLVGEADPRLMLSLVLYLIPLLSFITLIVSFWNKGTRIFGFLTGLLPIIGIIYLISEIGDDFIQLADIGIYITILASIGILIASFLPYPISKKET